jgi:polyhydroxyalkanoate synthase subunit PhaC
MTIETGGENLLKGLKNLVQDLERGRRQLTITMTDPNAFRIGAGEREVNAIGYCLGGTLLAATLSYLTAKNECRIRSATYFVTLVDFTDAGDLAVFIDEQQLAAVEKRMRKRGYFEGKDMAMAFNMLRANDLIWNAVKA